MGFSAWASERCAERSAEDNSSFGIEISLEYRNDKALNCKVWDAK
jgi:hypothetical protein